MSLAAHSLGWTFPFTKPSSAAGRPSLRWVPPQGRRRPRASRACVACAAAAAASAATAARLPVRPGRLSAVRSVPANIPRPPYVEEEVELDIRTGLPRHPFMYCTEVKSPEQIEKMRKACALTRQALEVARDNVRLGATTDDADKAVHEFVVSKNAYPSPLGYLGFKKSVSTSVNDVIAHGIPDDRPLEDGDILNVDVTVFVDGFHGDTSCMFTVGEVDEAGLRLCQAAQQATMSGIQVCGPGVDFRLVGEVIEDIAEDNGCNVSDLFLGHGIGSYFHGQPEVFPYANDKDQGLMLPGMTFTVEPVLVENFDETFTQWDDQWTFQTLTNARSAQFEHTILITETGFEILTGPSVMDFAGQG